MYVMVKVRKIKVENTKTNKCSVRERRKRTLYRNVRKIKGPLYRGCTVFLYFIGLNRYMYVYLVKKINDSNFEVVLA